MKILINQRIDTRLLIVIFTFIIVLLGIMSGRQHYQNQLMIEQFRPQDQELEKYISQVISRNLDFFNNPLEQINREQVQAVGNSVRKAPSVESQVLNLFSVGKNGSITLA